MRPFGCLVTILNTIDHLGEFNGKADEGFFVGYSLNSKAFRVFNSRTRIVEENLHIRFSESILNVINSGPDLLFDIDALTRTINYKPIVIGTQSNGFADSKRSHDDGTKPLSDDGKKVDEDPRKKMNVIIKRRKIMLTTLTIELPFDLNMHALEDVSIFNFLSDDEDDDTVADINNLDTTTQEEPKKVIHALKDPCWIEAIQEEHLQFKLQEVWTLVDLPNRKKAIGSKWVFKNKKDERGIVIRNKARLVAQRYIQEEGVDYDEVFSLIARIKAIRLFLAYASFKYFMVHQMNVKVLFSIRRLKKWCMYVNHQDLKIQAFLIEYTRLKKHYMDYIKFLKLVYMDDIIFGSTKKELCIEFEKMMDEKFQMSAIGELTFFLGLQVKQKM
nr:retrovirus-related Pol polyprotein from transposon TNT 1-94 [Tanacetum cinerariifolium]